MRAWRFRADADFHSSGGKASAGRDLRSINSVITSFLSRLRVVLLQESVSIPALFPGRSEEHTSELQSLRHLVCRLLLEKTRWRATINCLTRPRAPPRAVQAAGPPR